MRAFFKNDRIRKYTHDTKPLHRRALELGCKMEAVRMDTALAGYLLNPSASGYDVERLCAEYGVALADFEEPELNFGAAMPGLCQALEQAIAENNQQELLEAIEIPLSFVLAQMEHIGFYVDRESIQAYGKELEAQVNQLHDEIIQEVGYEFNINSPKQLGEALFGKLGLPHGKKTKSGWSTNADVLEELRLLHPVVDKVLRYRTVAKLKSTYCDGLLKVIGPDGRVHSTFNQTETRTGRISSAEPNLQNIPVRTPIGRELRKFFAGSGGNLLVDADYSQIELRVLAHVADDAAMKEDFLEGRDIHTATAARVFQMPVDMVTKDMRSKAKAVNFGIVYGIGAFSLSKDIGVTRKEADDYIKEYLRNYAGVDAYMKRVVEEAKEKGYVETLFGRRRYLPELKSGNFNLRAFGERGGPEHAHPGGGGGHHQNRHDPRQLPPGPGGLAGQAHPPGPTTNSSWSVPRRSGSRWSASSRRRWRGRCASPCPWWRRLAPAAPGLRPRSEAMGELLFCCPLCGGALTRQEHRAVCPQGHSFDVARQGYVHLLPVNKMHSKLPGDSPGRWWRAAAAF